MSAKRTMMLAIDPPNSFASGPAVANGPPQDGLRIRQLLIVRRLSHDLIHCGLDQPQTIDGIWGHCTQMMSYKGSVERIDEGLRLVSDEFFPLRILHQCGLQQSLIVETQLAVRPFVLLKLPLLHHHGEFADELCDELPTYGVSEVDEQHSGV